VVWEALVLEDQLMADQHTVLEVLGRDECLALLQTADIGRVAWSAPSGHPVVLPVNFVVDGEQVVFKSSPGGKLDAVRAGQALSFEADDVEPAFRSGWSVLITGAAQVVTDPDEVRRLETLPLAPWAPRPGAVFVRLVAREVSGRRIPEHAGGVTFVRIGYQ
jgi:nitroimidazol reductase NimA-like FMN-containing flavoprotein (pyridoxamine 5'-phosphate oxidase superfamily)